MIRVELVEGTRWFWRLVGANGEILAHSEQYSSFGAARKTARLVAKQLNVQLTIPSRKRRK